MAPQGKEEHDARLIAAAEAAASWARARRATWTKAPLAAAAPSSEPLPPIEFEAPLAAPPEPASPPHLEPPPAPRRPAAGAPPREFPPLPPTPPAVQSPSARTRPSATPEPAPTPIVFAPRTPPPEPEPPPFIAAAREHPDDDRSARSGRGLNLKWVAAVAAAAAVGAAAVIGWPYVSRSRETSPAEPPGANVKATAPKSAATKPLGALRITSSPAGAQVLVDGKARGVTPLTLSDVQPGKHDVVLKSDAGSVRRSVTIRANQTETVDEQIFSGWVTVYSPFEVAMAEGQRVLRPDERNQVMLAPGVHELRLENKALAYEAVLQVNVKPGEGTNVRLTPPPSSLTVTATEAAEVLVDGARAGDTPLNNFSIPLGTHEIVVRRPNGGEKRQTVTIGVKPFTLNVVF